MKYLIAGLGNPGAKYDGTRHNIGFEVLDHLASKHDLQFSPDRHADSALLKHRGRQYHLIKPTTYMNLSGKAVNYWLTKLSLSPKNLLVVMDDIALPIGKLRLRPSGSDAGHNGLKSIEEHLNSRNYPRLRFGIGDDFPKGGQVDYVLGNWTNQERKLIQPKIELAGEIIVNFGFLGIERTMNQYNNN